MSKLTLKGFTSGQVDIQANPIAGTGSLTFPLGTDTLVSRNSTDILTNKTIDGTTNSISLDINSTQLNISLDNIIALKALINRPSAVILEGKNTPNDGSGGIFYWSAGDNSTADDVLIIQCTSGPAGRYKRLFDNEINAAWFAGNTDVITGYMVVTTIAGNNTIILAGTGGDNPQPNFTISDIGKYIIIDCVGNSSSEGRHTTTITGINSTTSINVAVAPPISVTALSTYIKFGTNKSTGLQDALDAGTRLTKNVVIPSGNWMIGTGLISMPPTRANGQDVSGPLCRLDPGCTLIAVSPITAVITYGSSSLDYSGFLRQSTISGGTIDGNFLADYCVDIPFYEIATRQNQSTKNSKLSGVRWGRTGIPASGGSLDLNNKHTRDIFYMEVLGVTNNTAPIVTTRHDHYLATGRIITFAYIASGMTQLNFKFFKVTVTGAKTFTLNNTDSTSWGIFTGSAYIGMCMPSMRIPRFVSGITNANPGVVTVDVNDFTNGMTVWGADQDGMNLGGIFTVANISGNTFQLSGTNTSTLGTYTGYGSFEEYINPASAEKAIYFENGIDADIDQCQINGVKYGIYSDPNNAGYDSKFIRIHFYNRNEQGQMFAAIIQGGDNTYESIQFDLPFRYAFMLSGPRNDIIGSRVNYTSGNSLARYNNYASFVRLNGIGEANMIGGGMKADIGFQFLGLVSMNNMAYGLTKGFTSIGVKYSQVTRDQPNTVEKVFKVYNGNGNASTQVDAIGEASVYVFDRTVGKGGIYLSSGGSANTGNINTCDATGTYVSTPVTFTGQNSIFNHLSQFSEGLTISDGRYVYTPYNGVTNTGTIRSGIQLDGTNQSVSFYTNNIFQGSIANTGIIYWQTAIRTGVTTVTGLPSPAVGEGCRMFVNDATQTISAGLGAIVVGGGSNKVPVYSDGINWRIG